MTNDARKAVTRAFEMALEIDASPEVVWEALTNAQELMRWFPLEAEVEPGVGGSMRWSWGEAWTGIVRIDAWDPPRFIRLVDENARPYDADGRPIADPRASAVQLAVEVTLESISGRTRLTLVHSGFGHGASWDDEVDGVSNGWQSELRSLRHYLTRHRGRDRHAACARGSVTLPIDAVWSRLFGAGGVALTAPSLEAGQPYVAQLPTGDRFTGAIELYIPGRELFGTAAELGDGVFRVCAYPAGGRVGFMLWMATYEPKADTMRALEDRAHAVLSGLFP